MAATRPLVAVAAMLSLMMSPYVSAGEEPKTGNAPGAPVLYLGFSDESGQPVKPTKALLTVIFWGDVRTLPLPAGGAEMAVPLTAPESMAKELKNTGTTQHLYFEAEGYAPIRSNEFVWPGSANWADGPPGTRTLDLGRNARAELAPGKDIHLRAIFRKPGKRCLRFLDEAGKPVTGVRFSCGPFSTNQNHCGWPSTIEDYGVRVSDAEGRADIRDADVEYLFKIEKDHFNVLTPMAETGCDPGIDAVVARLSSEETVFVLHRWARVPLEIQVLQGGKPAKQRVLSMMLADCCCGACGGTLAVTDDNGKITLPDFYPETCGDISFSDEGGGRVLWKMTRDEMLTRGVPKVVDLGN